MLSGDAFKPVRDLLPVSNCDPAKPSYDVLPAARMKHIASMKLPCSAREEGERELGWVAR
jgi:hypothetical protein